MQDKIQEIRSKVADCVRTAEAKFGVKLPQVDVRFDLRGRAAGQAGFRGQYFYLRFNLKHMQLGGQTWTHLLNNTVPHEVAHFVCQAVPKLGRNHDRGWKRVCIALGGNGERCYSEEDAPEAVAVNRPWVYITTTGHEVRVTKIVHSKIQQGAKYTARGKGALNRECQYNFMTAPAQAASKKPVIINVPATLPPAPTTLTTSKADAVRALIREAKQAGQGADTVVAWAVKQLGMTPALAKTYIRNNWNKV